MNQFDSRGRRPRGPSSGPGRGRGPAPDRRPPFRPRRPPTTNERFADARGITFEALGTFENRRAFVSDALEQLFYERSVLPSDKGLATEMSYGIARRIATVDALLNAACSRPQDMVQDGLWRLMRIGAYQLAWLQSIPAHAAIHETVELAHRLHQPGWAGFLNAVLRRLQRDILPVDQAGWSSQRTLADIVANPDPSWLPLREANSTAARQSGANCPEELLIEGLALRQPVFPNPFQYRSAYWAAVCSYPEWMIDDWCRELGETAAIDRAFWFNSTGRMCLRVSTSMTTREATLAALEQCGIVATAGQLPESILLDRPVPVSDLPGFWEGQISIQDESAMMAPSLLAPQPGWRVLDLCAAPGGKTVHMAEQMHNQGQIIACDSTAERLPLIQENCDRLAIDIVRTQLVGLDGSGTPDGPFHAALVDVPCSNTGVLGKRPEVRWRFVPGELRELIPIQMRLLRTALDRVPLGGRVVYSTCSVDPRENEQVVREVLNAFPAWKLSEEHRHVPGHPVDGGYAALLVSSPS